jgi:hypothetical protein
MSIYNEKTLLITIIRKLTFLRIVILTFFVYGSLNYSGFCFEEMRYLSDEDKIHIAVTYVLNRGFKGKREYQSVNDFLANNPHCCSISTESMITVINDSPDRTIGNLCGYVYVLEDSFDVRPEEKAMSAIAISNCGKAWSFFD